MLPNGRLTIWLWWPAGSALNTALMETGCRCAPLAGFQGHQRHLGENRKQSTTAEHRASNAGPWHQALCVRFVKHWATKTIRLATSWAVRRGEGGALQEDAAGHTQPPLPPLSDISDQSCLAGCLVRPTAVLTAALWRPAVSRPLQNYSALRLTWQSSLFSAAGLKYLL